MRQKFFFLILIFSFLIFFGIQSGFSAETIRSIQIETEASEKLDDMRSVIRIKEGDLFDPERLENAIYDLRKWGIFKNVEALVEHEKGEVSIHFQLEAAFLIKNVEVDGNYPILERSVKRAIFMTPGDIYQPERIPEQIDRLIAFYEKEGYPQTSVFIEEKKDPPNRMVTLTIKIRKGKSYRVGDITVNGNTIFIDNRIKNKITRVFGYSPKLLKKNVESIEELYHAHDHPRARVKVGGVYFDDKKHQADITLEIREGKKIQVDFEGNDHQFSKRLKKIVSISETGDTDEFELEHSKNQLLDHYQSIGYEGTEVQFEKKEINPQSVRVLFKIKEGTKRVIKSIDFEGNRVFSDKRLKSQMQTQEEGILTPGIFLGTIFEQDLERIESFYQENGFIDSKIKDWKKTLIPTRDKYRIEIELEEGKQTRVEEISFEGLQLFKPEEIHKFLIVKKGELYSVSRLEEDVRAVLVYYANHGHPYTEAKTEVEEVSPERVKIRYKIIEGAEVKIGKILLVGNFITRPSTLRKSIRFKEGDLFNPQKILESQTDLRRLGIFDTISLETLGLKGKEETIHVVIRVEEKKDQIVDLGFTYDTDIRFRGTLNYTHLNLFGRAKHYNLRLTGGNRLDRGDMTYTDPRLLGSYWQYLLNGFVQYERRPFFQDIQTGGSTALIRELTRKLSVLIKYELVRTDFTSEKAIFSAARPGQRDNTTGKFQFFVTYDGRDNFGDPRFGIYASGMANFGTEFTESTAKFFTLGHRFGYWWSPYPRFTIANALRLNGVIPVTSRDQIPPQELLFIGGDDTVRGFKQDSINPAGGKVALVYNLEFQMRVVKGLEVVAFTDTGSLTNRVSQIDLQSIRHSAGVGVRYITPVGPVRLDYGFILDRNPGENRSRLHFIFGYFF